MVEIPDQLECLFSTSIDQQGDSYRIEIPRSELEQGTITSDETYRVAIVSGTPSQDDVSVSPGSNSDSPTQQSPPVEPGDVREVTIESLGDQGDGIAKIDRGYGRGVDSGRGLRSWSMLAEDRVREVVEVGLAVLAPVLLGVLVSRSPFDDGVIFAMDTRHHLAEAGETEPLEASFTRWKEDLS
jgi:hypothetical protein